MVDVLNWMADHWLLSTLWLAMICWAVASIGNRTE
jgi:hypothetical protein